MSICKYCGNPIEGESVMNPDEYGNGYHHFCLIDKEFREEQRRIYNKGRADAFKWIPVSERLPEELEPVNITWINHNPESYYADIKDKPFTATGVYFNGQWYWWSTLCTDILAEYSHNYDDIIDDDIEITAWMPLPEPYRKGESKWNTYV